MLAAQTPSNKSIRPPTLSIHLICASAILLFASFVDAQTNSATPTNNQFVLTAIDFKIPSSTLAIALDEFAKQSGLSISENSLIQGKASQGLTGRYTPQDALAQLLNASGLTYRILDSKKIIIEKKRETATLKTVHVNADSIDSAAEGSYTVESTTTNFKIPLSLRETPQAITVVPQAVIKDFGLTNMRQILQFTPGISVFSDRGPQSYYFQARGNDMQVQYDGIPSSNSFGGRGTGMTPDSAIIERVEILSGAAGLLTGPGRPGGTVNIVRKLPTDETQVAIEIGGDSWGGWRGMADASGQLGDSGIDGRIITLQERQDFYIDYTSAKHSLVYGVLRTELDEHTEIYGGVNLEKITDGSYGSHYGLPSNIDGTPLDIPRKKNLGATWNDQDDSLNTIFLHLRHELSPDWTLHGSLTYEDYNTHQLEGYTYREREADIVDQLYFSANIEKWALETHALDLYLTGNVELFGRKHELMAGLNGLWKDNLIAGSYTMDPSATVDIATWDARKAPSPYATPFENYSFTGDYQQYGGFAGARFSLADPLHLILGSRLSWIKWNWGGATNITEDGISTFYGGLVWDLTQNLSVYSSYSDIFEAQPVTLRDRNGNVLDPIIGENLEAGIKLEAFDNKLNGSVALFRLDQRNLAISDYEDEAPGICGKNEFANCFKAAGLVRMEGIELSFSGKISQGWQVFGGYTKFDRKYRLGPEAGNPYNTKCPSNYFHLATTYSAPGNKWSIGASARWQESSFYKDTFYFMPEQEFRSYQGAYTIVGLYGSYQLAPKLKLSAAVDNLFDKKYFSGLDWPLSGLVYGDARKLSMTLRAEF